MKIMRNATRTATILVIAAALGLSACGKKEEPVTDIGTENITTEVPVDEGAPVNSVETAPPANVSINVTNTVAPPPAFTDTEQMRDDADATGLTSRLPTEDGANETQPAQ
jgi:hypothetical protein